MLDLKIENIIDLQNEKVFRNLYWFEASEYSKKT